MNKEQEAWLARYDAFYEAHPECPKAKDIENMNLIMKRNFAEDIKNGKKKVEFRAYSPSYCSRLFDSEVDKYIELHQNDEEVGKMIDEGIVSPMRLVRSLHFHNYNNSWHLDCECIENGIVALVPDDVKYLQETFDCHELDEDLAKLEARKEKNRPLFFYFVIGEIGDNNL